MHVCPAPIMAPSYFIVGEEERVVVVACFGAPRREQHTMNKEIPLPIPAVQNPMEVVVTTADNISSFSLRASFSSSSSFGAVYTVGALSTSGQSSSVCGAWQFEPLKDVLDAGPIVVATPAQCNKP